MSKTTREIVDSIISQAEIETGDCFKENEKILVRAIAYVLDDLYKNNLTMLVDVKDLYKEYTIMMMQGVAETKEKLANAANPIRFADENQARAFNAESAKYGFKIIIAICSTTILLTVGFWTFKQYSFAKKINNFKLHEPTVAKLYFE
jgi:hypothetical protein